MLLLIKPSVLHVPALVVNSQSNSNTNTPHGVEIKHGRLELCQFDGCDANCPDVAQLVVAALLLHRGHLRSHPETTHALLSLVSQSQSSTP